GVPLRNLKPGDPQTIAGGMVKRVVTLQQGIPSESARKIVKFLKDQKLKKVQATIQGDELRVSSPSKDELQRAIALLRAEDFRSGVPLRNLKPGDPQTIAGGMVKRVVTLQQGIPSESARKIVKFLKDQKLKKVQATIQGDELRVSSPSKDELQRAIALLRAEDF